MLDPFFIILTRLLGSDDDVSWSGPTAGSHGRLVCLAALVCLLCSARPARASGCHVSDRPALETKLSWEQDQAAPAAARASARTAIALNRPPCQSEVPRVLDSPSVMMALIWAMRCGPIQAEFSDAILFPEFACAGQPYPLRLIRPPRCDGSA